MEHPNYEQQQTQEPRLCAAGCGFWGNPTTEDFCSKCYREHVKTQEAVAAVAAASPVQQPKETAPSVPENTPSSSDAPAVAHDPVVVEDAPSAVVSEAPPAEEEAPEKPVQANRSRCFNCRKKVGLLGFECRCGYVFCSSHRHAQDHACSFDYAAFDRDRLAKANPLVAASKLDKL